MDRPNLPPGILAQINPWAALRLNRTCNASALASRHPPLAFSLGAQRFTTKVVTSRLRYDDPNNPLPPHEVIDGVEVFRVRTTRWGRHNPIGRVLDYATFYVSAGYRLWRMVRPNDIIVAKTDPPLISVVAACVANLRRAKLVNWQQDVFPEVAQALSMGGGMGRAVFVLLRFPRNWSLRQACKNVVLGERMAATLRGLGAADASLTIIANWADGKRIYPIAPNDNPLRAEWGLSDAFVVGYAGNLGRAHDIDTILPVIEAFDREPGSEPSPRVMFLFVGGGALRATLEDEVKRCGLSNVVIRDYQTREQLAATLSVADLHLVSLNPKLEGLIVPSKIYAIAAAGRPAIFIGDPDGEVARLIATAGMGFTVPTGSSEELRRRILELLRKPQLAAEMGDRGRRTFDQNWDRQIAVKEWEHLLFSR